MGAASDSSKESRFTTGRVSLQSHGADYSATTVQRVAGQGMPPEEFTDALYRLCLGHPPDSAGLEAWCAYLRGNGDPTFLLAELLRSPGYRQRRELTELPDCTELVHSISAMLGRRPRIVDVGAQSDGDGTHAYSSLSNIIEADVVGFDPLSERINERLETERSSGSLTLLPYAIADGTDHTLFVNNDDATSSLFPLDLALNREFNYLSTLRTVRSEVVRTYRLDDILPAGPVDFLKLDVQGAELMVLQNAPLTLANTSVVHCEVEFSPLYRSQPLYSEIQQYLADLDFEFIDFAYLARRHYLVPSGIIASDRLLWGDAVFFRKSDQPPTLISQALIAASVYSKPTLAEHLLQRALT